MSNYHQRFKTLQDRFEEKFSKTEGCWKWESAFMPNGYGMFWVGGAKRNEFAHRVSYTLYNGDIPDGMLIMHSCDNKFCVNPAHLSLGTHKLNSEDSKKKRRNAIGTRNMGGASGLDDRSAQRLKILIGSLPRANLCKLFGVSLTTYKNIQRGKVWKHVQANTKQALA